MNIIISHLYVRTEGEKVFSARWLIWSERRKMDATENDLQQHGRNRCISIDPVHGILEKLTFYPSDFLPMVIALPSRWSRCACAANPESGHSKIAIGEKSVWRVVRSARMSSAENPATDWKIYIFSCMGFALPLLYVMNQIGKCTHFLQSGETSKRCIVQTNIIIREVD